MEHYSYMKLIYNSRSLINVDIYDLVLYAGNIYLLPSIPVIVVKLSVFVL